MSVTKEDYERSKAQMMLVVHALLDTIKESGANGAPLGPMYLAFQAVGLSYGTFTSILGALADANQIRLTSEIAFYVGDLQGKN
jgi:hypothetical protein